MPFPKDAPPILLDPGYMWVGGRAARVTTYSSFFLLIWDTLITLDVESRYIWPARWTVIKVLFLFNRYAAPAMLMLGLWTMSGYATGLTDHFCRSWMLAGAAMEMIGLSLVTFVLIFRLHAALGAGRKGFLILLVLWLAGLIGSIVCWVEILWKERRLIFWENELGNYCFAVVPNLWALFMPILLQNAVLLCTLLVKVFVTPRSSSTAFLRILLSDGILFYSVTLLASLASVLIWGFLDWSYVGIPAYSIWAIYIIAVSRFLLSLKGDAEGFGALCVSCPKRTHTHSLAQTETNDSSRRSKEALSVRLCPLKRGRSRKTNDSPITPADEERTSGEDSKGTQSSIKPRSRSRSRKVEMIDIEAEDTEWWDEGEDRGPGVMESRLGRYDSWL